MGHTGHLGCSDFGFALREPGSRGSFAPGSGLSDCFTWPPMLWLIQGARSGWGGIWETAELHQGARVSGSSESGENSNSERISKVETIRSLRA